MQNLLAWDDATARSLVHLVVVACLAAAVALRMVNRRLTRATAGALLFWGSLVIATSAAQSWRHAASLTDFLLFRANIRGLRDFMNFDLSLVLGYVFVASGLLALPWLAPSSLRDYGHELWARRSRSERRSFLARWEIWMLAAFVWVALRWFSAQRS